MPLSEIRSSYEERSLFPILGKMVPAIAATPTHLKSKILTTAAKNRLN
ncbi:hypothetical protein [Nostoc sp. NMS4]|nr:hypothetical protein [Nostoc sp. NMS4]MBN3925611.1 hypothetical protein [Nostoc sp. NMS4]